MKKTLVIILTISFLFACGGCGAKPKTTQSESISAQPSEGQAQTPRPADQSAVNGKHLQRQAEYENCSVTLDFDLPETESAYPVYTAKLHEISGAEYGTILSALGSGQQWETVGGKPFDAEQMRSGSFQAVRPKGNGTLRATLNGSVGGSSFIFTTRSSMEVVLGVSDLNPYDADDRLLAETLREAPSCEEEDARRIADACVSEMGCFGAYRFLRGERALSVDVQAWEVTSDGWRFTYTPSFDALQTAAEEEWALRRGEMPAAAAPWAPMESLSVYVEKGEIAFVRLKNLTDYTETRRTAILTGDDMADKTDHLLQDQFDHPIKKIDSVVITVPKVSLIYAVIEMEQGVAQAIPCWEIFFLEQYYLSDSGTMTEAAETEPIFISAVDGSYVEPRTTMMTLQSADRVND